MESNETSQLLGMDWSGRTANQVFSLPNLEGVVDNGEIQRLNAWIRAGARDYRMPYLRLYHGTAPSLPILEQGLMPTSASRRRSFQSSSGYVYLATTPDRAEWFGLLGNSGRACVYEVIVPFSRLRADLDQLKNKRSVGVEIGLSVAESLVVGGSARVKGRIEPWAIQLLRPYRPIKEYAQTPSEKGAGHQQPRTKNSSFSP